MRKIRIGNDLAVQWSLVAKGTGEPFVVEGKDIRLSLKSIFATTEIEDFTAQGNTIAWTFKGAEQKQTGIYSLVVSVVDAQGAMVTTDVCQFVELVGCSCEADGADEAGVHTESIELTSTLEYVAGGGDYDDTALWKELENKVDKVEGLGLSEENYTTEEKAKLAGLENYDDTKLKEEIAETYATKDYVDEAVANAGGGEGCECATPDWNAQEGEAGYIENKPFYKEIKQPTTVSDFFYSHDNESWYLNGLGNNSDYIAMVIINNDGEEELNIFKLESGQTKVFDIPYDYDILSVSVFKRDNGYYIDLPNNNASKEYISNCIKEVFVKYIDDLVIPETIARKSELTELSAEVSGLKEQVDSLPSGESSVFWSVKGETTFNVIKEEFDKGKTVLCKAGNEVLRLSYIDTTTAYFSTLYGTIYQNYRLQASNNRWVSDTVRIDHKVENLDNGNVQLTIAGKSAEVATPQYVENLLGTIINGDY